jgi:hypothetical protein
MVTFNLHQYKQNNLRSYTHGQLCLEQAKVAIVWRGEYKGMDGKTQVMLISTGVARAIQGVRRRKNYFETPCKN